MEIKSLTLEDYKKWLLYSFDTSHVQNLYDLYRTVKEARGHGEVSCTNAIHRDSVAYVISLPGISEHLLLTEASRFKFLDYLHNQYFYTSNVDTWYLEKIADEDKVRNLGAMADDPSLTVNVVQQLVPHPKETHYFRIRVFFSAIFYLALAITVAYAILNNPAGIFIFLITLPLLGFLWLLQFLVRGIFVGMIKGESVEVTPRQYPEIYAIVKEETKRVGLKDIPRTYITSGHFNSFVTSFARSKILMLYSGLVETTLQKDYNVLRFVVAHELCHLKRKHLTKDKLLFPSNFIPFLYNAHSRGCEYTCDRAGYIASPHGAVQGILIMTTGKEVYSKINVEQHLQNVQENSDFWTWLSEKFRTHPHSFKRLLAIQEYSKRWG